MYSTVQAKGAIEAKSVAYLIFGVILQDVYLVVHIAYRTRNRNIFTPSKIQNDSPLHYIGTLTL